MTYTIRIRNFVVERHYFHSANVASVPKFDRQGRLTGESRVLLQIYMWVPESAGTNNLRKVDIRGRSDRDTCALFADLIDQLDEEAHYTEEATEALIDELMKEVHGEAQTVKQESTETLDQENENGTQHNH